MEDTEDEGQCLAFEFMAKLGARAGWPGPAACETLRPGASGDGFRPGAVVSYIF
jgi:hypothetical protein